ncbi:MAG TPA: hypothetical protein VLF63_02965 [Patescibacteria group bacterium]|nr:hypothetical protein [Patescibacteria group bacterium]
MQELIVKLKKKYPEVKFKSGHQFYWSPKTNQVIYKEGSNNIHDTWSLLHETGHALLNHATYKSDYELINIEVAAWHKAQDLAKQFNLEIDKDHIEDCLDTYRDWVYNRSICPNCTAKSIQQENYHQYRCFNCKTVWRVSTNRFCRTYRVTKNIIYSDTLH